MAGPTPVSALIHAATMVTAGVYLCCRLSPVIVESPVAMSVIAVVGALTALLAASIALVQNQMKKILAYSTVSQLGFMFAATIGLRQYDIKKVLAYSTVSQLGYMFLGVGTGAYVSGIFHLATHAFFKALLFLGSGSVIHAMHQAYHATQTHDDAQDMRNMGGLRQYMPLTFALMLIATLAISGIPPFSGFFSKDEILAAAFARGADTPIYYLFYGMGVLAALLTAFYMARLMAMTFMGQNRTGERERAHLHDAPWSMTGPLVVLGLLSLVGGVLNLPYLVGGHAALERWLDPVMAPGLRLGHLVMPEGSTEYLLVGAAVAVGVLGLYLGFRATLGRPILPAKQAPADTGLALVLNRKYYVDELYDAVFVRPLMWLSRVVLWRGVDQGLVDGAAVNGTAWVSRLAGGGLRLLQTGQVGIYVVLFLVGALWILRAVIR